MGKVIVHPMAGPGHPIYSGELFIGARIVDPGVSLERGQISNRKQAAHKQKVGRKKPKKIKEA